MHAAAMSIEVHVPDSHSLKSKRAAIKPILEGLRHKFRVSAAEVDHHDVWQRAGLGVAVVASGDTLLREILDEVERFVWSFPEVEVLHIDRHWLEVDS